MSGEQGHTPGPWERLPGTTQKGHPLGEGKVVIRLVQKREPGVTDYTKIAICDGLNAWDDAEYIIRAANTHPALVSALEEALDDLEAVSRRLAPYEQGREEPSDAMKNASISLANLPSVLAAAKGEHHAEQ